MERKIKLTKKELNAKLNQAYLEGYTAGIDAGKQYSLFEKNTINAIREALGLPPIKKKTE